MMTAMRWLAPILASILALAVGCGPVAYIARVPFDAAEKVETARKLEADKYSPYWWTRATQYLRMAREVAAHADFQGANRFGRLSAEAAEKAAQEAEVAAKDPAKRPASSPEIAPAKDE
jgi:hypothetical protein